MEKQSTQSSGNGDEELVQTAGDLDYVGLVASWVEEMLPELETALANGTLLDFLENPEVEEVVGEVLFQRYRALARDKIKHDPQFRMSWIKVFVSDFKWALQPPKITFRAEAVIRPRQKDAWYCDMKIPPLKVGHFQGPVELRSDQAISARKWGIWFNFKDELLGRAYADQLLRSAFSRLESNIVNLWNLEATYLAGYSKLTRKAQWGGESIGGKFECLMLDVLNENEIHARPAPLAEDLLEKTDFRVKYSGVKRRYGSRVQVSLVAKLDKHQSKINGIALPDEFICLTPVDLAATALVPPKTRPFANFNQDAFWESIGCRYDSTAELAKVIQDLFIDAMYFPPSHPLGPIWLVPAALRSLIRAFTEHGAIETSKLVQERESNGGRRLGSVDHYTSPFWIKQFTTGSGPIN